MQQNNEELQENAALLARQKAEVGAKNREVERPVGRGGKGRATGRLLQIQIRISGQMSHELRTPINSMLILSRQLAGIWMRICHQTGAICGAIHTSGADLLS